MSTFNLYGILRYMSIQQNAVWYPIREVMECISESEICEKIMI